MADRSRVLPFPKAPDGVELRHLRAFVAVAEELNFGRVAGGHLRRWSACGAHERVDDGEVAGAQPAARVRYTITSSLSRMS